MANSKLVFGPQMEPIFVPELVGNISGQSFPESASLAATPLTNAFGINPSAVLCEAYAVAFAEGLTDWKIELAETIADDVYGTCNPETKTITLSVSKMTGVAESRDSYLHELSHAKACTEHHGVGFEAVLHAMRHRHNRVD